MDNLSIRLYINPGNAATGDITEVFNALSDLHVAAGGEGLHFRVVPEREYSPVDARAKNAGCIPVDASPWTIGDPVEQEFYEYLDHPEKFL